MKYQSVTEFLDAQWAESWESLSEIHQGAWKEAAFPLYQWDDLSPEQRQSVAEQHDQRNDPANAEENSFWFDNASDISRIERDIQEIELQRTFAPSERAEKLRQLDDASQKLADLQSARFQPSTVDGASSGAPEPAPKVSSETAEPTTWQEHARTIADEPEIRKRAALIAEFIGIWPSIERDLSDASRETSGLAKAAKHTIRTFWVVEPALTWAKQRNKITKDSAQKFIKTNNESVFAAMLSQIFNI